MWRTSEGAAVARWLGRRRRRGRDGVSRLRRITTMRGVVVVVGVVVPAKKKLVLPTHAPSSSGILWVSSVRQASARLRCGHRRVTRRGTRARIPLMSKDLYPFVVRLMTSREGCRRPCYPPRQPECGPGRSSSWMTASTGSMNKATARPLCRWLICRPSLGLLARWPRRRLRLRRCLLFPHWATSWDWD